MNSIMFLFQTIKLYLNSSVQDMLADEFLVNALVWVVLCLHLVDLASILPAVPPRASPR